MKTLYLDTETYSELDLKRVGAWVYSHQCEVMLVAYAIDHGAAKVWDRTKGKKMPQELRQALDDPKVTVVMHNSQFDRWVLSHSLGCNIPTSRVQDTMVVGYACSLPGSLDQLGVAVGLDADFQKMSDGKKLIQRFCKPAPPNHKADRYTAQTHPEQWANFVDYAAQDVVAMREIYKVLPGHCMSNHEWLIWQLDQKINDVGLPVDRQLVEQAIALDTATADTLTRRLVALTQGEVQTAKQHAALAKWVRNQGVPCQSVAAAAVDKLLTEELPDDVREVLQLRQQLGRSSASKYQVLSDWTQQDGRLHGGFQYRGASRTGRWAGRGFQPHNLPRPLIDDTDAGALSILNDTVDLIYDTPGEVITSCIRSAIAAPQGRGLKVSDFANIEGRVLAWLAGESRKVKAFADFDAGQGADVYKLTYGIAFGVRVDDVDKDQRQIGKVMELACGYQGFVGAFQQMAVGYGVKVSDERAAELAGAWRDAHPNIVKLWRDLESVAKLAISRPGNTYEVTRMLVSVRDDYLMIRLPSSRRLHYYKPFLDDNDALCYWGLTSPGNKWAVIETYGGKLVENAVQAIARDLLAEALVRVNAQGQQIVGHVHDEIIIETDDDDDFDLDAQLQVVPDWAEGLPVAAEGYTSQRYRK